MRFLDKQMFPVYYRWQFLACIDEIAPEVVQDIQELGPHYLEFIDEHVNRESILWNIVEKTRHENLISEAVSDQDWEVVNFLADEGVVDEEIFDSIWPLVNDKAKQLTTFQLEFDDLIAKYCLETKSDWLRHQILKFLIKLCRYGPNCIKSLSIASNEASYPTEGDDFVFSVGGWHVETPWSSYEEFVRGLFDWNLANYRDQIVSAVKERGYRNATKELDYARVKWLVHWTVKGTPKEQILKMIKKERPSTMTVDTLNEYFRELEGKYDLPYRRQKRGKSPR